ncbi:unnamed protein product [Allacma fusca]|uniref:Uncharacterized protein n=1 Tax=Allacma fusca TaxID=39272 RepID=A0A8J2NX23_9HEXA|nr:unnamed protein product [Allacma fusca]
MKILFLVIVFAAAVISARRYGIDEGNVENDVHYTSLEEKLEHSSEHLNGHENHGRVEPHHHHIPEDHGRGDEHCKPAGTPCDYLGRNGYVTNCCTGMCHQMPSDGIGGGHCT